MADQIAPPSSLSAHDCAILQLEGWAAAMEQFGLECARWLGAALPDRVGDTVDVGGARIIRTAPRRFWMIADAITDMPDVSIDPAIGCSLRLGEGRVRLRLVGAGAVAFLSKAAAIDWHSSAAAPGHAAQTSIHHVPVTVLRVDQQIWDIFTPRSLAESVMEWIRLTGSIHGASP